jgi:hypothetical protein
MDHSTTPKQKARITAGAVAAMVIVGWIAILPSLFSPPAEHPP